MRSQKQELDEQHIERGVVLERVFYVVVRPACVVRCVDAGKDLSLSASVREG